MISPLFGYLAMELEHLVTAGSLDKLLNLALHAHDLEVDGDELVAAHDGRLNLCFHRKLSVSFRRFRAYYLLTPVGLKVATTGLD